MNRGTTSRLALLATAVALLALAGVTAQTTAASTQASTVRVGIIYSKSGLLANYGAMYEEGLRLGMQYLTHGTNTVNGHKIVFTFNDDAGVAANAVTTAKDLIGQGYKIIAGATSSGVGLALAPIAAQNKVLFISGPAANDGITGANRYTFRSGRQTYQDILAAKEILGKGVGKKITVFAQDSAFGQGNVAVIQAVLGSRGHSVNKVLVPQSATDFTPFASQAKSQNPDLLFVAWAGTTGPAMWKALQQQNVLSSTTVSTGLAERATWSAFPDGITFLSHYVSIAPNNKVNDWLVKTMRKRNQAPDIFTPDGFVAAQMIVHAVQKSGGDDVDKMISSLEGWQFVAPKGTERIRQQDHALIQPMFSVKLTTQANGKQKPVLVKRFSPGNLMPPVATFPSG
jgi:branched-chain amino acid transport system substrate-binding protein